MPSQIKVIDLFAGPGGLGEGFSSLTGPDGARPFRIAMSVEKEASAHKTLLLRAFYRQFAHGDAPTEYYDFLRGTLGQSPEDQLYKLPKFRDQYDAARREALCLELGKDNATADKALKETLGKGEDCILIGGPPCQAYSLVGRARRRGIGDYVAEEDRRNFLYEEYLRILKRCRPLVFVMENVKGMLSAEVAGERVFNRVVADLSLPWGRTQDKRRGYRIVSLVTAPPEHDESPAVLDPHDFVVRMENHGIPQARHRVILLGLREDLADRWNVDLLLSPAGQSSVADVTGSLPRLRSGLSKEPDTFDNWLAAIRDIRGQKLNEIRKTSGAAVWKAVNAALDQAADTPDSRGQNFSTESVGDIYSGMPGALRQWYQDPASQALLCNHQTRGHMRSDLHRYLFCAAWAVANRKSAGGLPPCPRPTDYPPSLVPAHDNFHSGVFADRFRVQQPDRYASTITSHIAKDGHYFIHFDPAQCRSLTVREAARIQTFPDNYFFQGNRTEQYVQVGNAVPPLLAAQIASAVARVLRLH